MVVLPASSFSVQPEERWVQHWQPYKPCHRLITLVIYSVLSDQQLQDRLLLIIGSGFSIKMYKALNRECMYSTQSNSVPHAMKC